MASKLNELGRLRSAGIEKVKRSVCGYFLINYQPSFECVSADFMGKKREWSGWSRNKKDETTKKLA